MRAGKDGWCYDMRQAPTRLPVFVMDEYDVPGCAIQELYPEDPTGHGFRWVRWPERHMTVKPVAFHSIPRFDPDRVMRRD